MFITSREYKLLKAFIKNNKYSLREIQTLLQISTRTSYRVLNELSKTLEQFEIKIIRSKGYFVLSGNLQRISNLIEVKSYNKFERLQKISYLLLTKLNRITNKYLQEHFWVSNVTVIQDVAEIEKRLQEFDLSIQRKKGYQVLGRPAQKRRFLAILLSNAISIQDFWQDNYAEFPILVKERIQIARQIFEENQQLLGEVDSKLREFLIILLSLADNHEDLGTAVNVSKEALDFSKRIFTDLAKRQKQFYNLQEIVYFANILDEVIIKRQEIPLFREKFDSEFYYSISQMVDAVSRFTKIDFFKDKLLFKLLFNHMRLSLAVPILFPERATTNVAYLAAQKNQFLHSIVSLVMRDIFPAFIQYEYEYELVTLHFASSLRRSPDIYPIRLLLVTDERPLTTSVLVSKIKNIAPFVEWIDIKSTTNLPLVDMSQYDYWLTTRPIPNRDIDLISTFPNTQEILDLQDKLQLIQENRTVADRKELIRQKSYDLQKYLQASSQILRNFKLIHLENPQSFEASVAQIVSGLDFVSDAEYLVKKLLSRFELSPLAIPNTNLALLHTQSHTVTESQFLVAELSQPVAALSMNHQHEEVHRVLVMLTKVNEQEEIRDMMTAISQSLIENNLYTEIYRTGNQEIIYQLLNTIFTEKIKKLEN